MFLSYTPLPVQRQTSPAPGLPLKTCRVFGHFPSLLLCPPRSRSLSCYPHTPHPIINCNRTPLFCPLFFGGGGGGLSKGTVRLSLSESEGSGQFGLVHFGLVFMFLIQQYIPALGHRLFALGVLPQLLHNLSCFLQFTAQVSFFEKADLPRPAFFFSSVLVIVRGVGCFLASRGQHRGRSFLPALCLS